MNDHHQHLRDLALEWDAAEWRAADYSYEPKGIKGVACDEWETFIISPGVLIHDDLAEYIAAVDPKTIMGLLDEIRHLRFMLTIKGFDDAEIDDNLKRHRALDELTGIDQEMGRYDEPLPG